MQLSHRKGITVNHKQAISLEEARVIMRSLVLAKGEDYVYPRANSGSCSYFEEDKPSCIVGHLLAVLGVDSDSVTEGESAYALVPAHFPATADYVVEGLNEAQRVQDTGSTWGEALKEFERVVERSVAAA